MSANACIVFFGLRFEVPSHSIDDLLENRPNPRIEAAEAEKLDVYWANFGGVAERFLLLIGKKIGILGPENLQEVILSPEDLGAVASAVGAKLRAARLEGEPALLILWEEDN